MTSKSFKKFKNPQVDQICNFRKHYYLAKTLARPTPTLFYGRKSNFGLGFL